MENRRQLLIDFLSKFLLKRGIVPNDWTVEKEVDEYLAKDSVQFQWLPMKEAPKDGTRILLKEDGIVYVAAWTGYNYGYRGKKYYDWVIPESWQDEQGGYYEIENPIGWMHCPI